MNNGASSSALVNFDSIVGLLTRSMSADEGFIDPVLRGRTLRRRGVTRIVGGGDNKLKRGPVENAGR